MNKFDLLVE